MPSLICELSYFNQIWSTFSLSALSVSGEALSGCGKRLAEDHAWRLYHSQHIGFYSPSFP